MNDPSIKNVTPGTPGPAAIGGGTRPPGVARRPLPVPLIAAVVVLLVLVVGWKLLHHKNGNERLAASVTKAIAGNNMAPVEKDFNALRRPELENRGKVGRLSDYVNAEGDLKGINEDTPSGSPDGYHHFIVHFAKGDLAEDMTLDGDGKIAKFNVHAVTPQ